MLSNILGSVASSILNNSNNNQSVAIQLIQVLLQSQGGIEGIIKRFQESGLEGIFSTDEKNQPISANQVVEVVGQENMSQAAQKVGVSEWDASNVLAEYLPKMVDMLTPNGQLPDLNNLNVNDLMAQAAKGMLGKLFS